MKKLVAFAIALIFVFTLSTSVFAEEGNEVVGQKIELTAENFGSCVGGSTADQLTYNEDGSVLGTGIILFGFNIPEPVPMGETVVVHIKGTSESEFRVWLLGENEKTASNMFKMTAADSGYSGGDFDKTFALTAEDYDNAGLTEAVNILFKGATSSTQVTNLRVDEVTIYYCTLEEYSASMLDSEKINAMAKEAKDKANAIYDKIAGSTEKDITDAIDAVTAEYMNYFYEVLDLGYDDISATIEEIEGIFKDLRDEARLESLSDSVKEVEDALAKAKASPNDLTVLNECLTKAKEAATHVVNNGRLFPKVKAKGEELNAMVAEIEALISSAGGSADSGASTDAATDAAEDGGGCGSALGACAVIVAVTSTLGCALISKKH